MKINRKSLIISFTLIEVLIVISIMAILIVTGGKAYSKISQSSRNAKRISDLDNLRSALQVYKSTNPQGLYPAENLLSFTCPPSGSFNDSSGAPIISPIPNDPLCSTSPYEYTLLTGGTNYQLLTTLENDSVYAMNAYGPITLNASYYPNISLSGNPVAQRTYNTFAFHWNNGQKPVPELPSASNWSVMWTGTYAFKAGTYTFTLWTDDGMRIYVDGVQIIDRWFDQPASSYSASKAMTAGSHVIRVDLYNHTLGADARVTWRFGP